MRVCTGQEPRAYRVTGEVLRFGCPHRLVCFLVPSTALVLVLLWEAVEPLACEVHLRNVSQQGQAHGAHRPVLTSSPSGAFWSPCHSLNYITVRRIDSVPGKQ